jgi:DNA invertase Pin-like site-specific DNA recombinase
MHRDGRIDQVAAKGPKAREDSILIRTRKPRVADHVGDQDRVEDTPTAVLVRQVLGAVAEFEKTTLVAKLAAARRRKRMATGEKVEGRKSHAEARPDVVKLAKALARKKPKGGKLSLRALSGALAEHGYLNERGRPFNPKSVAAMLGAK